MITLKFHSVEEFAKALFQAGRQAFDDPDLADCDWDDLLPDERSSLIGTARRIFVLYRVAEIET